MFTHSWHMRDTSIVDLNERCFIDCLPSGAWITATIEVAARARNETQATDSL